MSTLTGIKLKKEGKKPTKEIGSGVI